MKSVFVRFFVPFIFLLLPLKVYASLGDPNFGNANLPSSYEQNIDLLHSQKILMASAVMPDASKNPPKSDNNTTKTASQSTKPAPKKSKGSEATYQDIVDDYKSYLATVPENIRIEITTFRKEITRIQKRKKDLYQRLSRGAQEYLKVEEGYRRKLPIDYSVDKPLDSKTDVAPKQTNKSH